MAQQQVSQVRTTRREPGQEQRLYTFKAMQLIWLGLGVLEVLLGLRIIFKIIAVNPDNTLASLLYGLTSLKAGWLSHKAGSPVCCRGCH